MKDIKKQIKELGLSAPEVIWLISDKELDKKGCGPGTGWGDRLIPDTLFGLSVKLACIIHDVDFDNGESLEKANTRFLENVLRIIDKRSWWGLKFLRRHRAITYYHFVTEYGNKYKK